MINEYSIKHFYTSEDTHMIFVVKLTLNISLSTYILISLDTIGIRYV